MPPRLTIRDATAADAAAVAGLMGELGYPLTPETARLRIEGASERVLLAVMEGDAVGLLTVFVRVPFSVGAPIARITAMVVKSTHRRRGVGRLLIGAAHQWARDQGCAGVELTSGLRPEREEAHRFYESLGYTRTSFRFWLPFDDSAGGYEGRGHVDADIDRGRATVHLIHGYLCVGKTLFAKDLESSTGALRLTLDDWTIAGSGDRRSLDPKTYERLKALLDEHWISLARRGLDVILDFGFWRRSERDAARSAAARIDARTQLYLVTCPDAVARERCRRRTETSQVDYLFDEGAYDALLARFEPLGDDEERITVSTVASTHASMDSL